MAASAHGTAYPSSNTARCRRSLARNPEHAEAAFEELRSAMAANQAALEELRTTCNRLVTVLGDPRGVAYGRERPMIEQLVQVLLRQQYRELANRGGPLPDFADVEFRCNSQNGEDGILL